MRKAELLAQLQRADGGLDRARERLSLIEQLLKDRSALAEVKAEHARLEQVRQRLLTEERDLELEVDGQRAALAEVEKKLYSGAVRIPKELSALSDEAQQIRGLISVREDRLIPLIDEIDAANAELKAASERLEAATAADREGRQGLMDEQSQLREKTADLERDRQRLLPEIDAQSLRSYERLRTTRGGVAVAEVAQRTCLGCRISLPMSEEAKARTSEQLVFCQSCGRILHLGPI